MHGGSSIKPLAPKMGLGISAGWPIQLGDDDKSQQTDYRVREGGMLGDICLLQRLPQNHTPFSAMDERGVTSQEYRPMNTAIRVQ